MCCIYNKKNIFNMLSSSSFGTSCIGCRECNRQGDSRGATGTPYPHKGCEYEDQDLVFAFPCIECANQKKWQEDFYSGDVYCPDAPRVHTCERKP